MPAPIAVTGATGGLGGRVARRLADRGADLRLIARDPSRAPDIAGARVAQATYADGDAMRRALDGVAVLFLVSGSEAADRLDQHLTAVDAAAVAGVERVVYTSFARAAPDATFTFARDHFHTEQRLRDRRLLAAALRNNMYLDILPSFATDGVIRGPAGDGRFGPVARDDIADVAVELLLAPPDEAQILEVTGPQLLTMTEVAETMTQVTGRATRYEAESLEEAYASRAGFGAEPWEVRGWVTSYAAIAAGDLDVLTETVQRVAGHPPMTLTEFLRSEGGVTDPT